MNQHLQTVSIANARLPQAYEAAKQALAKCESVDECKEWADKAAALASYAKQADDDELEKRAVRIRARAIRRCGELLKQFDDRGRPAENSAAADTNYSQREAAEQAGMSKRQQVTAVRVANVPEPQFEEQIESPEPPTISQLAMQGFDHLQVAYTVSRGGDVILVPVDQLSDDELLARAVEYDAMAEGCINHAHEIRSYVRARNEKAA